MTSCYIRVVFLIYVKYNPDTIRAHCISSRKCERNSSCFQKVNFLKRTSPKSIDHLSSNEVFADSPINESFNDWGGRGCRKFVPVLKGNGPKIARPGDIFDQSPGEMSSIQGKLADHIEDRAVLSSEVAVLATTPGRNRCIPGPPNR